MKPKIYFLAQCCMCENFHGVMVDAINYNLWVQGKLIQAAMPDTSAEDREFLISHLCPKCQQEIFNGEE